MGATSRHLSSFAKYKANRLRASRLSVHRSDGVVTRFIVKLYTMQFRKLDLSASVSTTTENIVSLSFVKYAMRPCTAAGSERKIQWDAFYGNVSCGLHTIEELLFHANVTTEERDATVFRPSNALCKGNVSRMHMARCIYCPYPSKEFAHEILQNAAPRFASYSWRGRESSDGKANTLERIA